MNKLPTRDTILIRADASQWMGSGHLMRSLALAQGWTSRGGQVYFATCCDSDGLCTRLDAAGVHRIMVDAPHPDAVDLSQTLSLIQELRPAWTVLDGYHFSSCYQQALQETGVPLLVIDDMAHHPCYHADVLLNQNVYASAIRYRSVGPQRLLTGPRYALLRPEFDTWLGWRRPVAKTGRNILVTLGGADADNVTARVVEALATWRGQGLRVKVVVGPGNPHREALCQAIEQTDREMELLVSPPNMPALMAWADIAVSAAGTTALELAYMQVPTIALVLADNQLRGAEAFHRAGTLDNLGWHDHTSLQKIACAVRTLANHHTLRQEMAEAGRMLVDGDGVRRVINAIWK